MTNSTAYAIPGLDQPQPITEDLVIEKVCYVINRTRLDMSNRDQIEVNNKNIHSKTRKREIIEARRLTMVLLRYIYEDGDKKLPLRTCGLTFLLDHATVLHHARQFVKLIETDKTYALMVKRILDQLRISQKQRKQMVSRLHGERKKNFEIIQ